MLTRMATAVATVPMATTEVLCWYQQCRLRHASKLWSYALPQSVGLSIFF